MRINIKYYIDGEQSITTKAYYKLYLLGGTVWSQISKPAVVYIRTTSGGGYCSRPGEDPYTTIKRMEYVMDVT